MTNLQKELEQIRQIFEDAKIVNDYILFTSDILIYYLFINNKKEFVLSISKNEYGFFKTKDFTKILKLLQILKEK